MQRAIYPIFMMGILLFSIFAAGKNIHSDVVIMIMVPATLLVGYISEQIYIYNKNPEKKTTRRDLAFIIINLVFLAVMGFISSQILKAVSRYFNDEDRLFHSENLGPIWMQVLIVTFGVELGRYFIHRAQHRIDFLWKFHAQHHSPKRIYSLNGYYTHPLDLFLRHGVPALIFAFIGFDAFALAVGLTFLGALSNLSHCGADLEYGILNKFFATGQVHRWHHSTQFGSESKNYAPSIVLWDRVFGTYYFEDHRKGPDEMGLGADEVNFPLHSSWQMTLFPFRKRQP